MVGRAASVCAAFVMMLGSCFSCGMLKSTWIQNLFVLDGHLISILAPALLLNVDVGVFQQGVVTLGCVGAGCLDLGADYFIHLLQGLANLFFDSLSHWCNGELHDLLTHRSAKVRAKYGGLGTIFKGTLDGFSRAASMLAVFMMLQDPACPVVC